MKPLGHLLEQMSRLRFPDRKASELTSGINLDDVSVLRMVFFKMCAYVILPARPLDFARGDKQKKIVVYKY